MPAMFGSGFQKRVSAEPVVCGACVTGTPSCGVVEGEGEYD